MTYKINKKKIILHGTTPGYDLHKIKGEVPCDECKRARAVANKTSKEASRCGTIYGYRMHIKQGSPVCSMCQSKWTRRVQIHRIGTVAGYTKHLRDYKTPCDECKRAWKERKK